VLCKNRLGLRASARTVQKYLRRLGWKKRSSKFWQYVSIKNRIERMIFAKMYLTSGLNFDNSIFIDESTVQMNINGPKHWSRRELGEPRNGLIGRYSHPASVHVLGGISRRGATSLEIFSSRLNGRGFTSLLGDFLVPFVRRVYPDSHRLHMDNAPSHSSVHTSGFLDLNEIFHFRTPPQSPDINPIEMVWNDIKYHIKSTVKPKTRRELINGILYFWRNKVTVEYCNSKINHLNRVLQTIIINKGKATGL
jgi:transposase